MTNVFVPDAYAENTWRLALGLDPIDALHGTPSAQPVQVDLETGWKRPRERDPYRKTADRRMREPIASRTNTGRHILLYHQNFDQWVDALNRQGFPRPRPNPLNPAPRIVVRIFDRFSRFVPRRLSVPTVPETAADDRLTFTRRRVAPFLFPGAAYALAAGSTGLRGRVMRDLGGGQPPVPLRWARIVARLMSPTAQVVGRAFSDDRGEFLLLLRPSALGAAQLEATVTLRIVVSAPATAPAPSSPAEPAADEWWDLPVETIPDVGDPQPVVRGEAMPDGYVTLATPPRTVQFIIGRILTGLDELDFMFAL